MSAYTFICPDCEQKIDVNASMREAILSNGCPVCTGAVKCVHFTDA